MTIRSRRSDPILRLAVFAALTLLARETFAADCAMCPELVTIPAGDSVFGSPADDEFRGRDEPVQARVAIATPFAVSKYEITRAQYDAFSKATKRRAGGDCHRPLQVGRLDGFDMTLWVKYSGMDTTGYKHFDPLPCTDAWRNTSPVGSLQPNAFGVHDMIGNVSEWVEGCHTIPAGAVCDKRVAKGGSWGTLAHNLRTADRFPYPPGHRDDSIGIRVAKTLSSPPAQ